MRFELSITRRNCLRMLLAVPGLRGAPTSYQRYYQAGAQILFCGVTIFSRKDVGGGYAVAEEVSGEGQTSVALQFAGGSWPNKAHGVNKLGYMQETVTERVSGETLRAEYFGFMTSAPEKNFDQAKQGFLEKGEKPVPFNAAGGAASGGIWNFSVSHLLMSSRWTFAQFGELDREVRRAVAQDQDSVRSQAHAGGSTFLNSLRQAVRNSTETTEHLLIYNGKPYQMRCTKQTDGALIRLNGTLEETATGQRTPFKLWYERDAANYLPVRIEYKAKPFLKLVFEADPHWRGPAASKILIKESA